MAKAQQLGVKATTGNTAANECDELRLLFREPTAVTHGHDAMDAACGILSDPGLGRVAPPRSLGPALACFKGPDTMATTGRFAPN